MERSHRAASISLNSLSSALSHNLRLHAKKYESISALCRACDVNRQQFNKYLTGETLPSLLNLVKIANVLGVELDELVTPPSIQVQVRKDPVTALEQHVRRAGVDVTTGYYLDYTTSSVYRDNMLVAISRVEQDADRYTCRVKLILRSSEFEKARYFNYYGSVFASKDAVYLNYAHEKNPEDMVYCILQHDVRYSQDYVGVRTAMSNGSPAIPFAASFYMQYIGENPDLRAAIRQCGVFPLDRLNEQQRRIMARLEAKTQTTKNIIRIGHA